MNICPVAVREWMICDNIVQRLMFLGCFYEVKI